MIQALFRRCRTAFHRAEEVRRWLDTFPLPLCSCSCIFRLERCHGSQLILYLLQTGNAGRVPLAAVPSILAELGAQCPGDEVPRVFGGPQRAPDGRTIGYRDFLVSLAAGNLLGHIGMGCAPTGVAGGAGGAPPAAAGAAAGGAGGSAAIASSAGTPVGIAGGAARRASFTQEAALAREGDSAAAAQLAADTARRLHSSEERHGASSGSLRRPSGGRASLTGGLSVPSPSPSLSVSVSGGGADSARMPPADDPAALAWAFHLMLEAFLQLSNGGCIHKKDLLAGMTQLAMLSPSTRTLQHGRKDKPVRTHALEVTADGAAAPVGEGAGGAGDGEHHVGFAPGGAAATVIGTAAAADAGEASSAGPTATDAAAAGAADGSAGGGDVVQAAARRGSASGPREPRSSGAGSALAEAAAGATAAAGGDHRPRIVPASALEFLTAERWRELDKNGDASVTLLEFLGCFMTSWLSTDDDDDEEDDDEGESDSAALASQRAAADAAATGSGMHA